MTGFPSSVIRSTTFPVVRLINPLSRRTAKPTPCSLPISGSALHQTGAQLYVRNTERRRARIFVLLTDMASVRTRSFHTSIVFSVSVICERLQALSAVINRHISFAHLSLLHTALLHTSLVDRSRKGRNPLKRCQQMYLQHFFILKNTS